MGSYEQMSPGYIDSGDPTTKGIKQRMDADYQQSYPLCAAYWQQGAIDMRFKAGDQTLWSMIYGDTQYYQARRFFFNLIRRHINMICGYQRKNRKSAVAVPVRDADQLADDYNAILKYVENRAGSAEYFSQAFEGGVSTGQCLVHMYMDYTMDPISGDLFEDTVSYNNFLIDPYYRKQDFSDCNFIWRRRWVSQQIAMALLPGRASEIKKMRPTGIKDGRFPMQAELLNLNTGDLYCYDEYHYRDMREATLIIDPRSGESHEWEPDETAAKDELDQILSQQPWLVIKKIQKPTVKLAISLGGKTMYDGPNLLGVDEFPFVPLLCYYEPDLQSYAWRCQGVIRNLRDAQYLYNRRKVIELDILESQINSGWIYPIDAVTDPKAFRQSGQGFLVPLKAGHLPGEVQRIDPPGIPESMLALSQSLSEDITKISGVNEELLGAATDDKAALLSMMRQGAGLTTLQTIFDKADYSLRLLGKLRLNSIRKNFSPGKVRTILGHDPDPRFFNADSTKYDIIVEEGMYTTSQRQLELEQKLRFREMGMPIPDESIIKSAFISGKAELIEQMQQASQAQQQQQQAQAQEEAKKTNSDIMAKFAKAKADLAIAQERVSKIADNTAQAEHNAAKADMELVKMMIELEDLDRRGLREALDLADLIKNNNLSRVAPAGAL